ncbi:hypothetical protein LIER_17665 [Lithospermum erythrorhizon]|uniref:Uncharacterized protein n=1 Tax=Lithospermum erythrorhizon TaxID=34254 RepID=A0AAV3QGN8_LITER
MGDFWSGVNMRHTPNGGRIIHRFSSHFFFIEAEAFNPSLLLHFAFFFPFTFWAFSFTTCGSISMHASSSDPSTFFLPLVSFPEVLTPPHVLTIVVGSSFVSLEGRKLGFVEIWKRMSDYKIFLRE